MLVVAVNSAGQETFEIRGKNDSKIGGMKRNRLNFKVSYSFL